MEFKVIIEAGKKHKEFTMNSPDRDSAANAAAKAAENMGGDFLDIVYCEAKDD